MGVRRAAVVAGREIELDLLVRAVRAARAGDATCILLVGEGGVGKSRLLAEAAAAARQLSLGVLAGRAPITTPVAFSVVAEALRSWLRGHPVTPGGQLSPFDPGLRLVLPEWGGSSDSPHDLSAAQTRLLALEGIVQLARDIAQTQGGAVVLLDDLHAADPESLEAARYLASAGVEGVSIVGALRPGEAALADDFVRGLEHAGTAQVFDLTPLDERAVTELVAALLDSDPPAPLVADIMARTDGVPLLVEEVLDAHLRAGSVEVDSDGTRWRGGSAVVPKTVTGMVERRMERLSRGHADVLVAGAVLGDFAPALLESVAGVGVGAVDDALAAGVRVGLLETGAGAIGFRHAVIREAVLESTLPHVVTALHMRAAAALSTLLADATTLERRAHHLIHVGEDDDAAALLATAADIRVDEHALLNAEALAQRAFDLARAPATRASAADARARALAAQGRWLEALDVDRATVAEHGETSPRQHRMAISAIEAGRPELAGPIIARAIEAGDLDPGLLIVAGRAAVVTGKGEEALAYARQVLDDGGGGGDLDTRLAALELQGRAFDYLGDRPAAEESWTRQEAEALSAGRTQARLRALVQLGKVELFAGRPPVRLHEAVEVARAAGALIELSWAEENLAVALAIQGNPLAASALLDDAIRRCRELRIDNLPYLLLQKAATDSYVKGPVDTLIDEAEALSPADDLRLHSFGLRGDIALRDGRYDDAVHWLGRCKEIMDGLPGVVPSDSPCWLVWALAAAGRAKDAATMLEEVRAMPDLARWYGRPVVVAAGAALLAGDEAGIDDALAAETGNMPFDRALLRVLGAEILRGPSRARWLREALDAYEVVGASFAAERVRQLLRAAGGSVPRRRRAGGAVPDDLARHGVTAREAEVLRLVGEGLANAVIAERLYLSVRTVETHVSSLLSKLQVDGRGQLTALSAGITYLDT